MTDDRLADIKFRIADQKNLNGGSWVTSDLEWLILQLDTATRYIAELEARPTIDAAHEYKKGDAVWIASHITNVYVDDDNHAPLECFLTQKYGGAMTVRFLYPTEVMPRTDLIAPKPYKEGNDD